MKTAPHITKVLFTGIMILSTLSVNISAADDVRIALADSTQSANVKAQIDFEGLERRLKETKTIGLFVKLSLKGKINDLVKKLSNYHAKKDEGDMQELRMQYDQLVAETLNLLKGKDSALYTDLFASREAIWKVLQDPVAFAKL